MTMKNKLEEYIREDGANMYQTWFDALDAQAAAKVTVAKTRLNWVIPQMSNGSEVLVSTRSTGGRDIAFTWPRMAKR